MWTELVENILGRGVQVCNERKMEWLMVIMGEDAEEECDKKLDGWTRASPPAGFQHRLRPRCQFWAIMCWSGDLHLSWMVTMRRGEKAENGAVSCNSTKCSVRGNSNVTMWSPADWLYNGSVLKGWSKLIWPLCTSDRTDEIFVLYSISSGRQKQR